MVSGHEEAGMDGTPASQMLYRSGVGAGPRFATNTRSWTPEEDKMIIELVVKFGPKKWTTIACHLDQRTGKQCRERWAHHLDPSINKAPWTPEEDRIIIEANAKHGNKWALISKLLPGRTDNSVKNRWNSNLSKRLRPCREAMDPGWNRQPTSMGSGSLRAAGSPPPGGALLSSSVGVMATPVGVTSSMPREPGTASREIRGWAGEQEMRPNQQAAPPHGWMRHNASSPANMFVEAQHGGSYPPLLSSSVAASAGAVQPEGLGNSAEAMWETRQVGDEGADGPGLLSEGLLSEAALRRPGSKIERLQGIENLQDQGRPAKRRRVGILRGMEVSRASSARTRGKPAGKKDDAASKEAAEPLASESPRLRRFAPELCALVAAAAGGQPLTAPLELDATYTDVKDEAISCSSEKKEDAEGSEKCA